MAIKWMKENFKLNEIKKVIYRSKNLSLKSANFWRIIFNLNKNDILCLKKSFRKKTKSNLATLKKQASFKVFI